MYAVFLVLLSTSILFYFILIYSKFSENKWILHIFYLFEGFWDIRYGAIQIM